MEAMQPPSSREAEAALLGAVMLDQSAYYAVCDLVEPGDFYEPRHEKIFSTIRAVEAEGGAFDVVVVAERLRAEGRLDEVGGVAYIASLVEATPESSHAEQYARIVKEKAVLRNLISVCGNVRALALEQRLEVDEILERAERDIFAIARHSLLTEPMSVRDVLMQTFERLDELAQSGERHVVGVGTDYHDLDAMLGGLQRKDLIILAARPSVGKTTLALNLAERIGVRSKKPVAIFSIETSSEKVAENLLCIHQRLNPTKMRRGMLSGAEYERLSMAMGEISESPIFIDDTTHLTPLLLKSKTRRLKARVDLQLIIVDYLQLMDVPGGRENRQQAVAEISRHLKALARELDVPVLAVSQLRRAAEEHGRPRLSDLRESGAIEQDADVVLLLHRQDYQEGHPISRGEAELIIAKQRHGPTGTVRLHYDLSCLRFESAGRADAIADEMVYEDLST